MSSQPGPSGESWLSEPRPINFLPPGEMGPDKYASILTSEDMGRIRGYCFVPIEFDLGVPGPSDRIHCPPVGWMGIYEDSLKAGLRFPIPSFVIRLLTEYNMCPAQIAPNSWRIIIGFLSLCLLHKRTPTINLFRACYSLKTHPDSDWWYFSPKKGLQFIRGAPSSVHGWKTRFLFVRHDYPWRFNINWRIPFNCVMNEAPSLTGDEEESLAYLRACEAPLVKDLICEEALVNVGLSQAEPQGKVGF